ncbi:hypothetical protein [Paracoccus laeviglucosivorans]|uniref:Uncharacterized protein n=1 Tax=Paracoccus laeviglucosivorans TaxID=1197861 RepID=A0A521FV89_9RHOB|nr:hypothetical protein [Paracoccus laeviglucosivorans]SMP00119.1 hypothetical protein SAMN06265221_1615 [Paracoccus laeviglucosivorans]
MERLTVSNDRRIPSDVVTIAGLQEVLDQGWQLHVICQQDPELRGYQWYGSWYLVAVSPDQDEFVVLVTARDHARERQRAKKEGREERRKPGDIAYREIKTAIGVTSLLMELGFKVSAYPIRAGESLALPAAGRA